MTFSLSGFLDGSVPLEPSYRTVDHEHFSILLGFCGGNPPLDCWTVDSRWCMDWTLYQPPAVHRVSVLFCADATPGAQSEQFFPFVSTLKSVGFSRLCHLHTHSATQQVASRATQRNLAVDVRAGGR